MNLTLKVKSHSERIKICCSYSRVQIFSLFFNSGNIFLFRDFTSRNLKSINFYDDWMNSCAFYFLSCAIYYVVVTWKYIIATNSVKSYVAVRTCCFVPLNIHFCELKSSYIFWNDVTKHNVKWRDVILLDMLSLFSTSFFFFKHVSWTDFERMVSF